MLVQWLHIMIANTSNIDKYYEENSILRTPDIFHKFIVCATNLGTDIPFKLSLDYEIQKQRASANTSPPPKPVAARISSIFSSFW